MEVDLIICISKTKQQEACKRTASYQFQLSFKKAVAKLFNRISSSTLNRSWEESLIFFNRSNVMGSITQDSSVLILLIATYVMPAVYSEVPRLIHALGRVKPWLLCIVIAHDSFKGICSLSWNPLAVSAVIVMGQIGTMFGKVSTNDGSL